MSTPTASYQIRVNATEFDDGEDLLRKPPVLALVEATVEQALTEAFPDFEWNVGNVERLDI